MEMVELVQKEIEVKFVKEKEEEVEREEGELEEEMEVEEGQKDVEEEQDGEVAALGNQEEERRW